MRASFTSFVAAVLVSTMAASAAPIPGDIGDAVAYANNNLIQIEFNPATVDWNQVNWSSVFSAEDQKQKQQQQQTTQAPQTTYSSTSVVSTTVAPTSTAAPAPASSTPVAAPTTTEAPAPAPATTSEAPAPETTSEAPAPETSSASAPESTGSNNSGSSSGGSGSLWGLTYSPYNTDGSCPDVGTVAGQLAKVAAVTSNIRLYSTDCSQLSNALQAITSNNLNLNIHAGIWISNGDARMQSDLNDFVLAAKQYGTGLIKGVSVGNEDISKGMG
ncbi:hypothetical protein LPJ53_006560, partial [Coemansia erecta]